MKRLLYTLLFVLIGNSQSLLAEELVFGDESLNNIETTPDGFLQNIGSDGYLTFSDLNVSRDQACGLRLELEFQEPMKRPGIFEIFWHGPNQGFAEARKAFVVINQQQTHERHGFMIPLCKMFHFSGNINQPGRQGTIAGIRLDYPANRTAAIKFHSIELIDSAQMTTALAEWPADVTILEPYERVHARSFTSLDVIVPKLFFAVEEGLRRLWHDKAFLFTWLLMMAMLLIMILRSVLRQERL